MKTQKHVNCSIVERKYVILSYLILSQTTGQDIWEQSLGRDYDFISEFFVFSWLIVFGGWNQ